MTTILSGIVSLGGGGGEARKSERKGGTGEREPSLPYPQSPLFLMFFIICIILSHARRESDFWDEKLLKYRTKSSLRIQPALNASRSRIDERRTRL